MKHFREERGSSLVVVMLVTLIFTVFGLFLLSTTMSGSQRTEIRNDDYQSLYLAEKGIDKVMKKLEWEINNLIPEDGMKSSDFVYELEKLLNSYIGKQVNGDGSNGTFSGTVMNWEDINKEKTLKKVTVSATGFASNQEKTLTSNFEFGVDNIPEALKYALGSYICKNCDNKVDGEGNMFLHGGIHIQGDLKVDNNLITAEHAFYTSSAREIWAPTWAPSLFPTPESIDEKSALVLGKDIYTYVSASGTSHPKDYSKHVQRDIPKGARKVTDRSKSSRENTELIKGAFFPENSPRIIKKELAVRSDIKIKELVEGKHGVLDGNVKFYHGGIGGVYIIRDIKEPYATVSNYKTIDSGQYILYGNNMMNKIYTHKSDVELCSGNLTLKEGGYIGRNLDIGLTSGCAEINPKITLNAGGPVYINGNLTIQKADVKISGIFYVKGEVYISDTTIDGLTLKSGKNGSMIVFSEGNVNVRNNNMYKDNPGHIHAFFYSKSALGMHGVLSNIKIEGGLSGRRIVLNAVQGKSYNSNPKNSQFEQGGGGSVWFQKRAYQKSENSRLQIIYNPEIIEIYSDLKEQEPIIERIDRNMIINREIVTGNN